MSAVQIVPPPEDQPESICFIEIYDNKPGQQRQQVFSGWMFASNPALSALEHPVYDIWVKEAIVSEEVLKQRLLRDEALLDEELVDPDEEVVEKSDSGEPNEQMALLIKPSLKISGE